ncbi:MAG: hypothetical protein KatS3mg131_2625 [Candidatus Tectimicrobiota bacterium]|nr:MAG: hypothetical protein KatS3mg131_2625 [Candidatus Tectomicrobia bacterium]
MRTAERLAAAVFLVLAAILVREALRLGVEWTTTGPGAGFVPLWLALAMGLAALGVLLGTFKDTARQAAPFFSSRQAGVFWLKVLLPMVLAVALLPYLGIYLVAALYLAVFAAWIGRHRWYLVAAVSLGVPLAMYLSFERFFRLPLPKSLFYGRGLPF